MGFVNVYFSLGSNLGDREANIAGTLLRMDEAFGVPYSSLSSLIETEPMGFSGGKFLNAVVLYRMAWKEGLPSEILRTVKEIEREMGRTDSPEYDEAGQRIYHSRPIDIDILFYGPEIIDIPGLVIPHKGIQDRPFVMIPLLEVARPSLKRAFPDYFRKKVIDKLKQI